MGAKGKTTLGKSRKKNWKKVGKISIILLIAKRKTDRRRDLGGGEKRGERKGSKGPQGKRKTQLNAPRHLKTNRRGTQL